MTANITLEGIDIALSNLTYFNKTSPKSKLIGLIRSYYKTPEDLTKIDQIPLEILISHVWDIPIENKIAINSKRKNISSLKNTVNKDFQKLFDSGDNPDGVIIGEKNNFTMSENAKEKFLSAFTAPIAGEDNVSLSQISQVLSMIRDFVQKIREESDTENAIDSIQSLLGKIEENIGKGEEDIGKGEEDNVGDGDEDDVEEVEIDEDEEIEEIDDDIEEVEIDEDEEIEEVDDDIEEVEIDEDEEIEEIDDDIEEVEIDEDEEIEEIDDDIEEVEIDEDEEIEEIDDDIEEVEIDEDEEIEEIDDDIEEVEFDEDEELEEVDDDIEEIEIGEDDEIHELDDDLEEIEIDEDQEIEELDHDLEEVESDEDQEVEEIDDDIEEVEFDEDEEVEEVEIDDDTEIEEIDDDIEEVEVDEDEEYDEIDEDVESLEIDLDDDEELVEADEIEIGEDEELVDVEDEEDSHDTPPELGLPSDSLGEFQSYIEQQDIDTKNLLSEKFDSYLGAMDRYFNQFLLVEKGKYKIGSPWPGTNVLPEKKVNLGGFHIGAFPITNALFEIFIEKTGYKTTAEQKGFSTVFEGRYKSEFDHKTGKTKTILSSTGKSHIVRGATWFQPYGPGSDLHKKRSHPVVQISLKDALSFAAWIGKRLPTEDEWEASARTLEGNTFPWGNVWEDEICNIENSGKGDTTPVDEFEKSINSSGIADTLGNVWEWTTELVDYGEKNFYVAKGGSFVSDKSIRLWSRFFLKPDFSANILGFRCLTD